MELQSELHSKSIKDNFLFFSNFSEIFLSFKCKYFYLWKRYIVINISDLIVTFLNIYRTICAFLFHRKQEHYFLCTHSWRASSILGKSGIWSTGVNQHNSIQKYLTHDFNSRTTWLEKSRNIYVTNCIISIRVGHVLDCATEMKVIPDWRAILKN